MTKFAAALVSLLMLAACHQQPSLDGTSSQIVNVGSRRIQVDVQWTGTPGEYRILAVRDTVSLISDPDADRENNRAAARRIMEQTCRSKNYSVDEGEIAGVNYRARFKCG